jgi:hypothetical protein
VNARSLLRWLPGFGRAASGRVDVDEHPRWCDQLDCDFRGEHRSRQMPADPTGLADVDVSLLLLTQSQTSPMVVLAITIPGDGTDEQLLDVDQAESLAYQLLAAVRMVKAGVR